MFFVHGVARRELVVRQELVVRRELTDRREPSWLTGMIDGMWLIGWRGGMVDGRFSGFC